MNGGVKRSLSEPADRLLATAFTLLILALGFSAFGIVTMLIFTSGFAGGLALWMLAPRRPAYDAIRIPYLVALVLFVVHRIEENQSDFFARLATITGVPTPNVLSVSIILLVVASVGAWLAIPFFVRRGYEFGYYLAWTFFAAMGITELAHLFVFPFFSPTPFAYFPGMASVLALAPVAWWGMYRLWSGGIYGTRS